MCNLYCNWANSKPVETEVVPEGEIKIGDTFTVYGSGQIIISRNINFIPLKKSSLSNSNVNSSVNFEEGLAKVHGFHLSHACVRCLYVLLSTSTV